MAAFTAAEVTWRTGVGLGLLPVVNSHRIPDTTSNEQSLARLKGGVLPYR